MTLPIPLDFLSRLKRIDNSGLRVRDILILWAIGREAGMMGKEIARKLGYKSRSNVQICLARLEQAGFIEDRRLCRNQMTPCDFYITPAGEVFLSDIVPE